MQMKTPEGQEVTFKDGFVERYSKLTDFEVFAKWSLTYLRRSIRVNTLKATVKDVKRRLEDLGWVLTPVPWCPEGFFVTHETGRRDIGSTVEHTLGYFYVQEAASMIPPLALEIEPGQQVLDLCAAPGSKTSQIAMYLQGSGALVANDVQGSRLAPLGINLQRCGVNNVIVTLMNGNAFKPYAETFDRVLVDAPCSGTGTIRKSFKTLLIWNPHILKKFSNEQLRLLNTGYHCAKPGGIVVYSTCSLEPEEDEEVISRFLEEHPDATLESINLKGLKTGNPVLAFEGKKYNPMVANTLRLWPQDNDTEGFFVAKIRKGK